MSRLNAQGHCRGADINSGAALPSDKEKTKMAHPFEGGAKRLKSFVDSQGQTEASLKNPNWR
jgi:hypothetical protein